ADALTAAIVLLAVIGPDTLTLNDVGSARPMPLLMAAFLQLGLGFWQRHASRYLLGTGAATLITAPYFGVPEAAELALLALLIGGARFPDKLGRVFQSIGAVLVLGYCLGVIFAGVDPVERLSLRGVEA